MRRRANSLDYLPSPSDSPAAFPKDSQHSPVENKSSPFTRTASLSQRPFKKKIAFAEPETGKLLALKCEYVYDVRIFGHF